MGGGLQPPPPPPSPPAPYASANVQNIVQWQRTLEAVYNMYVIQCSAAVYVRDSVIPAQDQVSKGDRWSGALGSGGPVHSKLGPVTILDSLCNHLA